VTAGPSLMSTNVFVVVCKLMSKGVFSFFTSHTAATISTIRSFSSTFQMPFVLANTAFNHSAQKQQQQQQQQRGDDLSYELYITPYYARAIVNVIEHYNWKDFWYIYKNDEGDMRINSVVDSDMFTQILTPSVPDVPNCCSLKGSAPYWSKKPTSFDF